MFTTKRDETMHTVERRWRLKAKKQNNAAEQSVDSAAAERRQRCSATKMQLKKKAKKRWRRARYQSVAVAVDVAARPLLRFSLVTSTSGRSVALEVSAEVPIFSLQNNV